MMFQLHDHTIRGLNYRLRISGAGRPVVLLHGLFDTGASFQPLIQALSEQTHTPMQYIAVDWRGHGDSDPAVEGYWFPDYLADLDALLGDYAPSQSTILIGHSMGGQVASMYAGVRPRAVSHLVTLDSLNVPDAPVDKTAQRYRNWLDGLRKAGMNRSYATIDAVAERVTKRYPELSRDTQYLLARNWTRPTAEGQYRFVFDPRHRLPFPYGFRADETMALWREVTAPTLCIDAGDSPAKQWMPEETMAQRRACFSNLTHEVIPDCGHMLHLQAPEETAQSIIRFLDANPV